MVMASFTISLNSSLPPFRRQSPSPPQIAPTYHRHLIGGFSCRKNRGSLVVTRGGAPGATTYIFAFVFPLSLLAATIFTSINISDKLDREFYEELEVNQSILEAQDEDGDVETSPEKEPARSTTRNRPKRESQVSPR